MDWLTAAFMLGSAIFGAVAAFFLLRGKVQGQDKRIDLMEKEFYYLRSRVDAHLNGGRYSRKRSEDHEP